MLSERESPGGVSSIGSLGQGSLRHLALVGRKGAQYRFLLGLGDLKGVE
jgi:hypothetical protein